MKMCTQFKKPISTPSTDVTGSKTWYVQMRLTTSVCSHVSCTVSFSWATHIT